MANVLTREVRSGEERDVGRRWHVKMEAEIGVRQGTDYPLEPSEELLP